MSAFDPLQTYNASAFDAQPFQNGSGGSFLPISWGGGPRSGGGGDATLGDNAQFASGSAAPSVSAAIASDPPPHRCATGRKAAQILTGEMAQRFATAGMTAGWAWARESAFRPETTLTGSSPGGR